MEEVQHFCTCLEAFLMDGYAGNIPQEAIHFQIAPLINSFWWKILLDRNVKSLDLDGVLSLITKLGAEFNPLNQRRLAVSGGREKTTVCFSTTWSSLWTP